MDPITSLQQETIDCILGERTRTHWHDIPEVAPLLDQLEFIDDSQHVSLAYLLRIIVLACESEGEQALSALSCLETVCTTAESPVLAQAVARFLLFSGVEYPTWPGEDDSRGWLEWSLEYKPELERLGAIAKKLWSFVKGHGLETEQLTIQWIIAILVKRRETEKENSRQQSHQFKAHASERTPTKQEQHGGRDVVYMLHCGPLMDHKLVQLDEESVLNALLRIQDNADPSSLENQMLTLVNMLERFFNWIEDSSSQERIGQLKTRVIECTKVPELAIFTIDSILRFLDGRWIKPKSPNVDLSSNNLNISLLDVNREREPIHYSSAGEPGSHSFSTSKHAIQGRALKAREVPKGDDRDQDERQFEIGDLVSGLLGGHGPEILEHLARRFVTHLWMRVDTAMVGASGSAIKHAAQQRDKVLLRLMTENPAYKKIMAEFLDRGSVLVDSFKTHLLVIMRFTLN
ncbi:hypothetical protein BGZ83_008361 [Gryganskiella cystojenkinii]|nr:hypothetical protein BGZ83_008361 [Gryganskiella cystojenkinii]